MRWRDQGRVSRASVAWVVAEIVATLSRALREVKDVKSTGDPVMDGRWMPKGFQRRKVPQQSIEIQVSWGNALPLCQQPRGVVSGS